MRDYQRQRIWERRESPPCSTDEPYIYLSLSPFDLEEGIAMLKILNEMGCRVWYDEKMLTGRPWSTEISDAIDGCSVFFEVFAPGYRFSLTTKLAQEYARLLDKQDVTAWLHETMPKEESGYPKLIYSTLRDPALPERCRQGLEAAHYFSAEPVQPAERKRDLMMDYYRTSGDWKRKFGGVLPQSLNLRTHESHGYLGHTPKSDEDVYAAVRYGKIECFYLRTRSPEDDYRPGAKDKAFTEKILDMNGRAPAELEREYIPPSRPPQPSPPFPAGYPYKDEFEYLSSDDDD